MTFPNHGAHSGSCSGACCLQVQNLGVTMEDDTILKDVSFHLHCGEIVALIGPNGAGKTSLFQSLLGQMPYSGHISFAPAGGKSTARPLVGYVPQSPAFDHGAPIGVLDFFAAAISNWPVFLPIPKKLHSKVLDCLERVHAGSLIDKRIGALSGGELQRVLLATALEPLPQILILDEPLSGVDVEGAGQLLEMLSELRRNYDLSILYSTHDFSSLGQYADKVILLQQEIVTVGSAESVLSSPEFREVFHLDLAGQRGWSE